jgi:hypothetical protein
MLLAHKAHEEQVALEHQRVLGMMRAENEKMLAEASQMRAHFAKTLALVPETTYEDVKLSQRRLYDESLEIRLILKAKMMEEKFEAEKNRCRRKEDDLVSAEERIEQLESTIRQLVELGRKTQRGHFLRARKATLQNSTRRRKSALPM